MRLQLIPQEFIPVDADHLVAYTLSDEDRETIRLNNDIPALPIIDNRVRTADFVLVSISAISRFIIPALSNRQLCLLYMITRGGELSRLIQRHIEVRRMTVPNRNISLTTYLAHNPVVREEQVVRDEQRMDTNTELHPEAYTTFDAIRTLHTGVRGARINIPNPTVFWTNPPT